MNNYIFSIKKFISIIGKKEKLKRIELRIQPDGFQFYSYNLFLFSKTIIALYYTLISQFVSDFRLTFMKPSQSKTRLVLNKFAVIQTCHKKKRVIFPIVKIKFHFDTS